MTSERKAGIVYVVVFAFLIVIAIALFHHIFGSKRTENETQNLYPMSARVIEVDRESDTVSCVDGAGNCWGFTGCEDWEVGDGCAFIMNDMGTREIEDDEIVSVRYSGL